MGRSGSFLTRTIATGLGLLVAVAVVPGLRFTGNAGQFIVLALIFGLVNAVIRPILKFLSCPLVLLTLGLFVLIINALMLYITQALAQTARHCFCGGRLRCGPHRRDYHQHRQRHCQCSDSGLVNR